MISRLKIAGVASLQDLESYWSLMDVVEANIDLDFEHALQAAEAEVPE
jgi:hypothetical protein